MISKVVDAISVAGCEKEKRHFFERLKSVYTLGTVVDLPRQFKFFGVSASQDDDASIIISNDENLQHITLH